MRSLASRMRTEWPNRRSSLAALRPAIPAPTTMVSYPVVLLQTAPPTARGGGLIFAIAGIKDSSAVTAAMAPLRRCETPTTVSILAPESITEPKLVSARQRRKPHLRWDVEHLRKVPARQTRVSAPRRASESYPHHQRAARP